MQLTPRAEEKGDQITRGRPSRKKVRNSPKPDSRLEAPQCNIIGYCGAATAAAGRGANNNLSKLRIDLGPHANAEHAAFCRARPTTQENALPRNAHCRILDTGARRLADRLVSCTGLDRLPVDHAPGVLEKTLLACSVERTSESSSVSPPPGRHEENNKIERKFSQGEKP